MSCVGLEGAARLETPDATLGSLLLQVALAWKGPAGLKHPYRVEQDRATRQIVLVWKGPVA